jgi:hypothetical protein
VPRLSLWKDGKHSNDYKFMDRVIGEEFTVGGTGVNVHKYLGTQEQNTVKITNATQSSASAVLGFASTSNISLGEFVTGTGIPADTKVIAKDATSVTLNNSTTIALLSGSTIKFYENPSEPSYTNQSEKNIQDLFFLENRDRKYDTDVYPMRGIYTVQDTSFDLSQFGMFLQTGTLFMTFHINDMVSTLGRKMMNGDVLELQHLLDYYPLDDTLPVALKRFYVVSDCQNAAEGFSQTWWPHLWRVKLNPLTDSQEYKDILDNIKVDAPDWDPTNGNVSLGSVQSTIETYQNVNNAIIKEAEKEVPLSGYDISHLYIKSTTPDGKYPGDPVGVTADGNVTADSDSVSTDYAILSPQAVPEGYLTGTGLGPNGMPVTVGIAFPDSPAVGDYALRTDYLPNRLFRYDGRRWVKIEDNVRTTLTPGSDNTTQRSGFVNNTETFTNNSGNVTVRQSLSDALKFKADN